MQTKPPRETRAAFLFSAVSALWQQKTSRTGHERRKAMKNDARTIDLKVWTCSPIHGTRARVDAPSADFGRRPHGAGRGRKRRGQVP
jgi:hypothetical protein